MSGCRKSVREGGLKVGEKQVYKQHEATVRGAMRPKGVWAGWLSESPRSKC